MRYLEPETVDEALDLLAEHGDSAKVIAGGQSLLILMRERLVDVEALIGLRAIPALREIEVNGGARIGAMVTHSAVERDERIAARWPLLQAAEAAVSTLQVRNRGTLCGNVAHAFPTADPPAALVASDGVVPLASRTGGEREVAAEDFFVGVMQTEAAADELLTAVSLPAQPEGARTAYLKYAIRPLDFAIVAGAAPACRPGGRAPVRAAGRRRRHAGLQAPRGGRLHDARARAGAGVAMGAIDFNADLGESFGLWERGADDELMRVISSANVACGFHAGDPATMRVAVETAAHYGVAVGSHPGLPDRLGFGRRRMEVTPGDVADYVTYQTGALRAFAAAAGVRLHHVKPHGALYMMACDDGPLARAIVESVARIDEGLPVYTLAGSEVWHAAA